MNFRKTIKKIMALGVGAAFIGATVMSATAADLKDYPAPFVKDGKFNAVIVVGDEAASSDVIGSVDVATSLQYQARVKKTVNVGSSMGVTLGGDSKKIEEATNLLELGENLTSIRSSVTSSDLKSLKDGTISNQYGTHTYTQVLDIPKHAYVRYLKDTSNGAGVHVDDEPFDYLIVPTTYVTSNSSAYRLKLSFSPALKSDHSTSGNNHLKDVKNKKIKILNKEYDILKADHTAYGNLKLTLMAGAERTVLNEAEAKTFTVAGKDYEVSLDFVGSTTAKFTVNGQVTDSMAEADTYRLSDGTEIGVVDILAQDFAGGKRAVEFTLGANKLVLEDTNTFIKGTGGTVTIGSTDSGNVKVDIVTATDTGLNDSSSKVTISSIEVYYDASEPLYVAKGESASAIAEAVEDEKGVFFLNGFDYKYEGLTMDTPEEIKLRASGGQNYKLSFTNKGGVKYDEFIFGNWSGSINFGHAKDSTSGEILVLADNFNVSDEDYVVVSKNKYSRILQFKDVKPGSSSTDNSGQVVFRDIGSGDNFEVTYSSLTGNLVLDGNTYQVNVSGDTSSAFVYVDMNGDGDFGGDLMMTTGDNALYTHNEAYITFPRFSNASIMGTQVLSNPGAYGLMQITSPQDEDSNRNVIGIRMTGTSDGKVDVSYVNGTFDATAEAASASSGLYQRGDKQVYEGYTYALADDGASAPNAQYGMRAYWDKKSSTGTDQDDLTIWVPKTSTRANVFVTSGEVTKSDPTDVEAGTQTFYETAPIEVGSAKLASEAGDVKAMNAIVVGGPCANTAAAALMGNPADCAAGFEEGKAMLKLFENNGNVAILVAGYSAMDTRRAARVLANADTYKGKLVGKEVVVAGTSFTDITVSAPSPAATTTTTTPAATTTGNTTQ